MQARDSASTLRQRAPAGNGKCDSGEKTESGEAKNGQKKSSPKAGFFHNKLAERTGLEPATPGVTGRYSNQLNYRSNFFSSFFEDQSSKNMQRLVLAAADVLASPRGFEPLYSP